MTLQNRNTILLAAQRVRSRYIGNSLAILARYRSNELGQGYALFTKHPLYLGLGAFDQDRQVADRALFRYQLDQKAIGDIRLALSQDQPLGNERFNVKIERMTGQRYTARPSREVEADNSLPTGQAELGL